MPQAISWLSMPRVISALSGRRYPADGERGDAVIERAHPRHDEIVADDRGGFLLVRGDQRLGDARERRGLAVRLGLALRVQRRLAELRPDEGAARETWIGPAV